MTKKKTKNEKIERIIKLINDGEVDNALQRADVNEVENLLGIGVLFAQNKNHDVAERIFDRVVQLKPNFAEAWNNKGVVLKNQPKTC